MVVFPPLHLLWISLPLALSTLEISVYEHESTPVKRLHRLRRTKDHSSPSSSSSYNPDEPSSTSIFSLRCPRVLDSNHPHVHIEVAFSLSSIPWLRIRDGHRLLSTHLTSFHTKRNQNGKSVMRVSLSQDRYRFEYDEIKGQFAMQISPVLPSLDAGVWQCAVLVESNGTRHSLASRARIRDDKQKPPHLSPSFSSSSSHSSPSSTLPPPVHPNHINAPLTTGKSSNYVYRADKETPIDDRVEISRENSPTSIASSSHSSSIVFNRLPSKHDQVESMPLLGNRVDRERISFSQQHQLHPHRHSPLLNPSHPIPSYRNPHPTVVFLHDPPHSASIQPIPRSRSTRRRANVAPPPSLLLFLPLLALLLL